MCLSEKQANKEHVLQRKKAETSRKTASAAMEMLKEPLQDLQTALLDSALKDGYVKDVAKMLETKVKSMMADALKTLTVPDTALTFDLKELRAIQSDVILKTRTPNQNCTSNARVSER